ncbi:MAG: alpha-amylase family glycosyl hydrolase, partial [Bacteroidota bacterium]
VEFKEEMQKVDPDVYLIGEVWASTEISSPYTQGLRALFNFDLAFSIIESLNAEVSKSALISGSSWKVIDSVSLEDGFVANLEAFKSYNPDFINATFLSNHDQNRVASMLGNDKDKIKQAAAILLTLPGSPYLYYGEELGMLGMKPDEQIREPFLWASSPEDGFRTKWIEPKYTYDSTVDPLSVQQKDSNSIWTHYKTLIHLRNENQALSLGDISKVPISKEVISFKRDFNGQSLWVLHNISSDLLEVDLQGYKRVLFKSHESVQLADAKLIIPAHTSAILE